jgi:hypothetical protein
MGTLVATEEFPLAAAAAAPKAVVAPLTKESKLANGITLKTRDNGASVSASSR